MEASFATELAGDVLKITVTGRLDPTNAPALMEELKSFIGKPVAKIVFFAGDLEYVSSGGLRVIIFARQKVGNSPEIHMVGVQEMVLHVLQMSGMDDFIAFHDTWEK